MIAILPKRALVTFSLVVLLRGTAGDELHALCDYTCAGVFNQKMNMVGGDRVIEYAKAKAFLRLEHPMQVTASVACKL